ncbi:hypothetical protein ACS0TY_022272 [Phlomoides rotata]
MRILSYNVRVRTSDLADLCLINIYAPCNPRDKKELWGILNMVIDQNMDKLICLAGDFNAVRNEVERVGRSGFTNKREMEDFDKFIRDSNLIDLPLSGRSYTWYRPDDSCKSRLDRFLLNEEWIACYPKAHLKGLPRSISDHCPLILEDGLIDWGPKPFRFSNAWLLHPSFKDSLISMWQNLNIGGRGSFIVKEKFKSLKIGLREWSKNTFGNLDQRIESNKQELLNLDLLDDTFGLEMDEIDRRRDLMRGIFWDCSLRQNILCQKAKIQWIKQGDVNTHYFHKCINARRKANDLSAVSVDDLWTWTLTNDGQYTTQSAYQCQVVQVPATSILSEDTYKALSRIWNKLTPSKFSGLAWRILRCRLPTRSALKKRNILTDGDDLSCGLCGSYEETVQHLFFECSFSYQVWCRCYAWLMSPMACASDPTSHFLQHSGALGWKRKKHVMECIWSCAVWFLWKARNNKVFEHKEISLERTFEEIRIKAWCLFSTHYNCSFSLIDWCNNPRMCCH